MNRKTSDLVKKGDYYEKGTDIYGAKNMKRNLTEYFGDNIVITNMDRKVDVVTFTSTASNILNCFYEVAADLVKYDKKYKHTSKDIYI